MRPTDRNLMDPTAPCGQVFPGLPALHALCDAQAKPAPYDYVNAIIEYENGDLDEAGVIELFQYLVSTRLAWKLQGHYGRMASTLINAGLVEI